MLWATIIAISWGCTFFITWLCLSRLWLKIFKFIFVVCLNMLYFYHRLECGPRACVYIPYQAKHKCQWYKCYVPHCLCRLIARQYELENWIYYIDSLGKFNYGPAHASSNHHYAYICQQKWVNPMKITESYYKRLNSCFVTIASFRKVY